MASRGKPEPDEKALSGIEQAIRFRIKQPPPAPQPARDIFELWLPTRGFPLQEAWDRSGYGNGYWVTAHAGDMWERAVIRYRGPEKEALAKVAVTCEEQGIEYDWDYVGRFKMLALIVTISDVMTQAIEAARDALPPMGEWTTWKGDKTES